MGNFGRTRSPRASPRQVCEPRRLWRASCLATSRRNPSGRRPMTRSITRCSSCRRTAFTRGEARLVAALPIQIGGQQRGRALLCRRGHCKQPMVSTPVHMWRFLRKGVEKDWPAAEPDSNVSGSPDTPRVLALGLARVSQIVAFSAREIRVAAIQHRDASPAAQAAAAPGADKPRTLPPRWHLVQTSGTRCSTDSTPRSGGSATGTSVSPHRLPSAHRCYLTGRGPAPGSRKTVDQPEPNPSYAIRAP